MKTFFLTLASALLLLSSCGTKTSDAPQSVNVMTFNIRLDTESDSLNAWPHRRAEVGRMLGYYAPDLLGMQEVLPQQMTALKEMLPQYTALGVGREDGKAEGEFSPIFFRTDRFELLRSGNFSLSPTPNEFGVKGWGAACNRICTWALLKDKQNGREVAYFNTHLDHVSAEARREGMRLIVDSHRPADARHRHRRLQLPARRRARASAHPRRVAERLDLGRRDLRTLLVLPRLRPHAPCRALPHRLRLCHAPTARRPLPRGERRTHHGLLLRPLPGDGRTDIY